MTEVSHATTTTPVETFRPQRPGASSSAWSAFLLGIFVSVAANIGHVWFVISPDDHAARYASMFGAALWPLLLALCVEVVSRVSYPKGWRWWLPGYLATIFVGLVAAVVSYQHMHGLLLAFGESSLTAAIGPVGVDGLLIVGGFAILAIGETRKTATEPAPTQSEFAVPQSLGPVNAEALKNFGLPSQLQAQVVDRLRNVLGSGRQPVANDLADVGIPASLAGRIITRSVNGHHSVTAN